MTISHKLLHLDFEHDSVSVFGDFEDFRKINLIIKAPTLVLDKGQILMNSTLILDYISTLADPSVTLTPQRADAYLRVLQLTGLALVACKKTMQIIYERNFRPPKKHHKPWIERIQGQLMAAYGALEAELCSVPLSRNPSQFGQVHVTIAVAWKFTQLVLPEMVTEVAYPALQSFSDFAEQLSLTPLWFDKLTRPNIWYGEADFLQRA